MRRPGCRIIDTRGGVFHCYSLQLRMLLYLRRKVNKSFRLPAVLQ